MITDERLALLEANARRKRRASTSNATSTPSSLGATLTILDTPVTLSSGSGGLAWTTQSGSWPANATHVYVCVNQGNGAGNFEVRKNSTATGYSICGAVSANNFSGGTAACAFVELSSISTFDWRNLANNSYVLTLAGYISQTSSGASTPVPVASSAAGLNTQVQYNNAGAFGASANLTFDASNNRLVCGGSIEAGTGTFVSNKSRMYFDATLGTVFTSRTGATYDLSFANSTGSIIFANPTGTNNFQLVNGGLLAQTFGEFGTYLRISGGAYSSGQNRLYHDATLGFVATGSLGGSTNDFTLVARNGFVIFRNPTGTRNIEFTNGNVSVIAGTIAGSRRVSAGVSVLTDAATIAVDASLGNHFRVTLGGNRTLGVPTNLVDGQRFTIEFIQDGVGSRTITHTTGSADSYQFGADIPSVTLTTTASARDIVEYIYSSSLARCLVIDVKKGY